MAGRHRKARACGASRPSPTEDIEGVLERHAARAALVASRFDHQILVREGRAGLGEVATDAQRARMALRRRGRVRPEAHSLNGMQELLNKSPARRAVRRRDTVLKREKPVRPAAVAPTTCDEES